MGLVIRFGRQHRTTFSRVPQGPWRVRVSRRRRLRVAPWMPLLALALAAVAGVASVPADRGYHGIGDNFALCGGRVWERCVVDGDTVRHHGRTIRLADIDAPETREPGCASEAALGRRATLRLLQLMNGGPFRVMPAGGRDHDIYGRDLRIVTRDGRSLGDTLVAEGLARRWDGARRSWCG